MPKEVYAFESAQAFDRAARATRFVERIMKGPIDPRDDVRFSQTDNNLYVRLVNPKEGASLSTPGTQEKIRPMWKQPSEDGFYVAELGTVDGLTKEWRRQVDQEGLELWALVTELNSIPLTVPAVGEYGKIFQGRVLGYYEIEGELPPNADPAYEDFLGFPIVGVFAGEPGEICESGSGGSVVIPVPTNIRCDPVTEEIVYDITSFRITSDGCGKMRMEVIE